MPAEQSISEETWSLHKHVLVGHHASMSVKDLRELMIVKYGFHASLQQYQRRFKKWDFTKYLKEYQWKDIHHALKRKYLDIGHSEVWVDDFFIDKKKLRKELPRYNLPTLTGALPALHPAELRDNRIDVRVGLTPSIVPVAPLRLPTFDILESLEKHNTKGLAVPLTTGFANQTLSSHDTRSIGQFLATLNPRFLKTSSQSGSRSIENQLYYQLQPWFAQPNPNTLIQDIRCMIRSTSDRAINVMLSYAAYVVGNHLEIGHSSLNVLRFVIRWLESTMDGGTSFLKHLTTTRIPLNLAIFDRIVLEATIHTIRPLLLKLLACGMDPNRPLPSLLGAATPLQSVFWWSKSRSEEDIFDFVLTLLEAKADPNLCGLHGSTKHDAESHCCLNHPVCLAAGHSDGRLIDALIVHGVFVRLCDLTGVLSSSISSTTATKLLHQFGSINDFKLEKALNSFPLWNFQFLCPLQAAAKDGDVKKVGLLLKHGADPDGYGGWPIPSQGCGLSDSQIYACIASPLTIAIEQKSAYATNDKSCIIRYNCVINLLLSAGANINRCIWQDRRDFCLNGTSCDRCCDYCYQRDRRLPKFRDEFLDQLAARLLRLDKGSVSHTALQAATVNGDNELSFSLLDMGADPNPLLGTPPLVLAVLDNNEAAIERLLCQGALPNHTGIRSAYAVSGNTVHVNASCDALGAAASRGLIHVMDLLIEANALVNNEGASGRVPSALQAACMYKQFESAEYLLSKGAIVEPMAACGHSAYPSPLFIAVVKNDIRTVELLVRHNANVNVTYPADLSGTEYYSSLTPLMVAIEHGFTKIAEILYQHGADIEYEDVQQAMQGEDCLKLFATLDKLGVLEMYEQDISTEILIEILRSVVLAEPIGPFECKCGIENCICDPDSLDRICKYRVYTADRISDRIMSSGDVIATTLCTLSEYLPRSLPFISKMIQYAFWRPGSAQANAVILALLASRCKDSLYEEPAMFSRIIADILDRGANPNGYKCQACPTPYLRALNDFDDDLCNLLVERGADTKTLPSIQYSIAQLLHAAETGNRRMLELMLELGADVNGTWANSPPHSDGCPLASGDLDELDVSDQYLRSIDCCLSSFYRDVRRDSQTAIRLAVHGGHVECALILISNGADISCPQPEAYCGRTNLQIACEKGNVEMVHLLLNHGADVNEPAGTDHGVTALQAAAIKGHTYIAQILIAAGADIGAAASPINGRTAIDGAAESGKLAMVTYLLDSYKGKELIATLRESASDYAREQGHTTVVEFLASYRRSTE